MTLNFLKKVHSASGRELFIFLMNRNWSLLSYYGGAPSSEILALESFLEGLAKDNWYYGGNMHIEKENQNFGIVITDPSAATFLMMSDYCNDGARP